MQNKLAKALFVLIVIAFVVGTIIYGPTIFQMQLRDGGGGVHASKVCTNGVCPVNYSSSSSYQKTA